MYGKIPYAKAPVGDLRFEVNRQKMKKTRTLQILHKYYFVVSKNFFSPRSPTIRSGKELGMRLIMDLHVPSLILPSQEAPQGKKAQQNVI